MTCVCWRKLVLSERKRGAGKKEGERDKERLMVEWWKRKEDWGRGGLLLVYNLKTKQT